MWKLGSFVALLPESGGLLSKTMRRLMRAQIGDSEGGDEGWLMSRIQLVIQKVYRFHKRTPATLKEAILQVKKDRSHLLIG